MSKRILIVEDEYILALDLKKQLTELGYQVVAHVATVEHAVLCAKQKKPDLILMDIKIHGPIDGIETARIIHLDLDVPIVYLSAYSDQTFLKRAKVARPFKYLVKPVNKQELAANIEMALYKHAMEECIKKNEAWFLSMLSSIGDGVIATDRKGAVRFMNAMAESLCGCAFRNAEGKSLNDVYQIENGDSCVQSVIPVDRIVKDNLHFDLPANSVLSHKKNKRTYVDGKATPLVDPNQETIGVILIFRDVTAYRQMEMRLRNLDRFQIFSQVVSGVAHEVQNPLNAILCVTEAMVQEFDYNPDLTTCLGYISTKVKFLSLLMNDLLELGRPVQPARLGNESFVELCEAGIQQWKEYTSGRQLDIVFQPPAKEKTFAVMVDAVKIRQVIFNLLENAVQHSQSNEAVELTVEPAEDHHVLIRLRDRGTGIPDKKLNRVFEPFFSDTQGGIGLGLSIVKNIVEQHYGSIVIRNNDPHPGCTVEIVLPVSKD